MLSPARPIPVSNGLIIGPEPTLVSFAYLFMLWIHVIAAISWIGGMIFLSAVLAPLVRQRTAAPEFMALFRLAARRFRIVVYGAIAALLGSGLALLHQRGLSLIEPRQWPFILGAKLGLVALLLVLTFTHDLFLGPRIRTIGALPEATRSGWERTWLRTAAWLPRLSLVLAAAVLWAAAVLARS